MKQIMLILVNSVFHSLNGSQAPNFSESVSIITVARNA